LPLVGLAAVVMIVARLPAGGADMGSMKLIKNAFYLVPLARICRGANSVARLFSRKTQIEAGFP